MNKIQTEIMEIDFSEISDVEVEGVDTSDYPDFCDAFISRCLYKGESATDEEIDAINENSDYVYQCVQEQLY